MTDEPKFERNVVAIRMEIPQLPPPEEYERQVRDRRAKVLEAFRIADDALPRLRAVPGALGAVLRLHMPVDASLEEYGHADCAGCVTGGCCGSVPWPCDTVEIVAAELGIALPEEFRLMGGRRAAKPVDDPVVYPTSVLASGEGDFFMRVPRPDAFVRLPMDGPEPAAD